MNCISKWCIILKRILFLSGQFLFPVWEKWEINLFSSLPFSLQKKIHIKILSWLLAGKTKSKSIVAEKRFSDRQERNQHPQHGERHHHLHPKGRTGALRGVRHESGGGELGGQSYDRYSDRWYVWRNGNKSSHSQATGKRESRGSSFLRVITLQGQLLGCRFVVSKERSIHNSIAGMCQSLFFTVMPLMVLSIQDARFFLFP